jgi:nucleoside-triphosphatase
MARILALTGVPGIGKTTVVRRLAALLVGRRCSGITTEEIRVRGVRQGFKMAAFDGSEVVFAHRELNRPDRISGYGVDVEAIDRIVARAFGPADVTLIDEIGKLECRSDRFQEAVRTALNGPVPVIAVVQLKGEGLSEEVKRRPGVTLWTVTRESRDALPDRALAWLTQG